MGCQLDVSKATLELSATDRLCKQGQFGFQSAVLTPTRIDPESIRTFQLIYKTSLKDWISCIYVLVSRYVPFRHCVSTQWLSSTAEFHLKRCEGQLPRPVHDAGCTATAGATFRRSRIWRATAGAPQWCAAIQLCSDRGAHGSAPTTAAAAAADACTAAAANADASADAGPAGHAAGMWPNLHLVPPRSQVVWVLHAVVS